MPIPIRETVVGSVFGGDPALEQEPSEPHIEKALTQMRQLVPDRPPFLITLHEYGTPGQYVEMYVLQEQRLTYSENYLFDAAGQFLEKRGFSDGAAGDTGDLFAISIAFRSLWWIRGEAAVRRARARTHGWHRRLGSISGWRNAGARAIWMTFGQGVVWGAPFGIACSALASVVLSVSPVPTFWVVYLATIAYSLLRRDDAERKARSAVGRWRNDRFRGGFARAVFRFVRGVRRRAQRCVGFHRRHACRCTLDMARCAIFSGSPIILLTRHCIDAPRRGERKPWLAGRPSPVSKTAPIAYTVSSWLSDSRPARSRAVARAATDQRHGRLNNPATRRGDNRFGNSHSLHDGRDRVEHPRAGRYQQGFSDAELRKRPSFQAFAERDEPRGLVPLALAPMCLDQDEASRASRARLRSTPHR